jgi:tetratricopeptide (TPR) repeat protein
MAGKHLWACSLTIALTTLLATSHCRADDPGQAKLDEAISAKLDANTPAELAKVIKLCEEALKQGLDEGNAQIAREILSASAIERAKQSIQQLPQIARNPNAVRRLKTDILGDLDKAIESAPESAEPHLIAARIHLLPPADRQAALQHIDDAIALLKENPSELSAAYLMRASLRPDNALEERLEDARLATEADPNNIDAWKLRIALRAGTGKLEEAYQDILQLLEQDAENEFAIQAAFEVMVNLRRFPELLELLNKQVDAKPEMGLLRQLRAQLHFVMSAVENNKGLLQNARSDADKAIELNPRDAKALILRGQILFDLGEVDLARRDISDALLIDPNQIDGVLMRSLIAAREKRYGDAIADMELLVRAFPDREGYVRQLAGFYQLDNRPRLAIRLLDELLKQKKDNWTALRQRGDAKLSVGEHAEAILDYERALAILETQSTAAANRDATETPDATEQSTEDEDAEPSSGELLKAERAGLLNNLAWVLATSPKDDIRDGKRALELGRKACELTDHKEAHILSTLAAAYAETGDFESARKWAAQAVEAGSDEDDPNEQLDQLKKELESYRENKPWREEQKTEENKLQRKKSETIET